MLKKTISLILIASVFCFLNVSTVSAEQLSQEKSENIILNCDTVHESLKKLQRADSKTRVALGTSYQTIIGQYITPLNVRLVKNNNFNSSLSDIQGEFVKARDNFNKGFISYSQQLEQLINADCKNDPQGFYSKLETTRQARKKVAESVSELRKIIKNHVDEVNILKSSFKD